LGLAKTEVAISGGSSYSTYPYELLFDPENPAQPFGADVARGAKVGMKCSAIGISIGLSPFCS
jgi:hypothetical protein